MTEITTSSVNENHLLLYKREPIDELYIHFIYTGLDTTPFIDDILTVKHEFMGGVSILKKEQLLYYIDKYRKVNNKKYKPTDLLLYVNNLDQENLDKFHTMNVEDTEFVELTRPFLRVLNLFDDIEIGETFLMFHSLTALYIVFKEMPRPDKLKMGASVSKRFIKSLKIFDNSYKKRTNKKR